MMPSIDAREAYAISVIYSLSVVTGQWLVGTVDEADRISPIRPYDVPCVVKAIRHVRDAQRTLQALWVDTDQGVKEYRPTDRVIVLRGES